LAIHPGGWLCLSNFVCFTARLGVVNMIKERRSFSGLVFLSFHLVGAVSVVGLLGYLSLSKGMGVLGSNLFDRSFSLHLNFRLGKVESFADDLNMERLFKPVG
jgi:hypothetical protein